MSVAASEELVTGSGGPPPIDPELPFGGGPEGDGNVPGGQRSTSLTGIVVLMCVSIMTFGAFLSAMVIRRGLGTNWGHTPIPVLLYWNTAALLGSSLLLDLGRRTLRQGERRKFNGLWGAGTACGVLFVGGQFTAWYQLAHRGVYATSNPSAAFFYVLTWAHAAHVVGTAIPIVLVLVWAVQFRLTPKRRTTVEAAALFWHFLDVMWIGILLLYRYWAS